MAGRRCQLVIRGIFARLPPFASADPLPLLGVSLLGVSLLGVSLLGVSLLGVSLLGAGDLEPPHRRL
jgi:hypothetical protein